MTQFIGTGDIRALLRQTGIERFLVGLAGYVETDFRRWELFAKDDAERLACGIELGTAFREAAE